MILLEAESFNHRLNFVAFDFRLIEGGLPCIYLA